MNMVKANKKSDGRATNRLNLLFNDEDWSKIEAKAEYLHVEPHIIAKMAILGFVNE
jgi:hypothetical protein